MSSASVTFRPITPDDMPFLYRVYASTRTEELAPLPWTPEQVTAFLTMQFNAQHNYYQQQFPKALYLIILQGEQAIGRLYREWRDKDLHVLDISLLPEYRGKGIGSAILKDLIVEATTAGCGVSIYVEFNNPALRLYERLGFRQISSEGVYHFMKRPVAG